MLLITTEANNWVPRPFWLNPCSTVRRWLLASWWKMFRGRLGEFRDLSKAPLVLSSRMGLNSGHYSSLWGLRSAWCRDTFPKGNQDREAWSPRKRFYIRPQPFWRRRLPIHSACLLTAVDCVLVQNRDYYTWKWSSQFSMKPVSLVHYKPRKVSGRNICIHDVQTTDHLRAFTPGGVRAAWRWRWSMGIYFNHC